MRAEKIANSIATPRSMIFLLSEDRVRQGQSNDEGGKSMNVPVRGAGGRLLPFGCNYAIISLSK